MSSDIAISVRALCKTYRILHDAQGSRSRRPPTFRDAIAGRLQAPFRRAPVEEFNALADINFDLKAGEALGIVGRNGAGKSTLLKILSRITKPTSGEVDVFGRIGSLLEVGTGFSNELTGRENIFLNGAILGMSRAEIRREFDAIVDFAEIERFLDTPVKRYSSGMYVRLAFAVAAHLRSEILIMDEVLAVGDVEFQKKCLGKMKYVSDHGRTVLFVSHNMAAVRELCSSALLLGRGRVQALGSTEEIISRYLDEGASSEVRPETGPLKRLRVLQDGHALVIDADWSHLHPIRLPNLGFIIYDHLGSPIVGANPYLLGVDAPNKPCSAGRITARLTEPRFLDGHYFMSAWFGDGSRDFIELPKCISFEVRGMASSRQYPASMVGPVAPACKFDFHVNESATEVNV
ncbi:MAG TPA: ABC transporter ATP-binding protein [Tepidisphaeraceae bacterium]|jgi:lipopolysaccharide transport system ATP-binding protein|nr:ABC transporter ATP-binding protein [Tepidisphaeraceae bacterium]